MNVLLTGAGGNLGRVVVPALAAAGHVVRATDFRPLDLEQEHAVVDVRDAEAVRRAAADVDAIVHAAALHGVHLDSFTPHEYWQTNVTGTFNVYEAAREAGVGRIVLCSTMAVYGKSAARGRGWAVVTEESETLPMDVYGLSKLLCEQLGRHYARTAGIATTALRLGMFVPETFERYGFRLLFAASTTATSRRRCCSLSSTRRRTASTASTSWPTRASRETTPGRLRPIPQAWWRRTGRARRSC